MHVDPHKEEIKPTIKEIIADKNNIWVVLQF